MKFKKLTGTRAHEARVLPGFQWHFNAQTFKQKISLSFKLSQTPTLKVSEKKEKEKGTLTNTHSHTNFQTLTLTYIGGKGTPIHGTLFFSLSLDWVAANCFG